MSTTFKKVIDRFNEEGFMEELSGDTTDHGEMKKHLKEAKLYLFIRDLLQDLESHLEDGEKAEIYMPITPGSSSGLFNAGGMAFSYVKKPKSQEYTRLFNSLRENRMLIFTDRRIIFFTVLDYLEEQLFFSYPYEDIRTISIKKDESSYFDTEDSMKKKKMKWYYLDFEVGQNIFSEHLDDKQMEFLMRKFSGIEGMKHINFSDKIQRKKMRDYLLGSIFVSGKLFAWMFILLAIGGIAFSILNILAQFR